MRLFSDILYYLVYFFCLHLLIYPENQTYTFASGTVKIIYDTVFCITLYCILYVYVPEIWPVLSSRFPRSASPQNLTS